MKKFKRFRLVLFDETGLNADHIKYLKLIILAVAFGTVCFNITGGVAMPGYLKLLGVSDFTYGLILAIGPAATLTQVFVSYILERTRKRKFIFMLSGILHRAAWLPFGLVPFIVPMAGVNLQIWIAVLFLMVNAFAGPFINVSFLSFIVDLVPMNIRGRYFSVRQRLATILGILGGLFTAFLLDRFSGFSGYALVFSIASVFGLLDILTFIFIKIPPMPEKTENIKFGKMLADVFSDKRYVKIICFVAYWSFAVNLAGPFYMVYTKTILNLSNTAITVLLQIIPGVCMAFVLPMWGRALDKYGNKPVMIISARMTCFLPFFWFFNVPGSPFPIFIFSCVAGGLLSPGLDFGAQNVYLGQAPEKNRSMFVAIYSCVTSLFGIGFANAFGGWLLDNPLSRLEDFNFTFFGGGFTRYNYLFVITSLLRIIAAFIMLPRMITEENIVPVKTVLADAFYFVKRKRRLWGFKFKPR